MLWHYEENTENEVKPWNLDALRSLPEAIRWYNRCHPNPYPWNENSSVPGEARKIYEICHDFHGYFRR